MTKKINTWFVGSDARKSALTVYLPEDTKGSKIILFAHGFKGFKDWGHFPMIQEYLQAAGFTVVAFNFSFNGGTVNEPIDFPDLEAFSENTYWKELDDIGYVLNWIKKDANQIFSPVDLSQISILGHSRGGAIALLAGAKYAQIKKVVTWAAVADLMSRLPNRAALDMWKEKGVRWIKNGRTKQEMPMKYTFVESLHQYQTELNVENQVKRMKKPLLVIHGKEDTTVYVDDAIKISQCNTGANLLTIENCNHTFNGKHPWDNSELPEATMIALKETITFLKK